MIIKHFVEGPLANNNYLLIDETSREAVLIDCTEYNPEVKMELDVYKAKLKYILLTHGHFDHILGVDETKKVLGGEILAHLNDKNLINNVDTFLSVYGVTGIKVPYIDRYIDETEELYIGDTKIEIIALPGHTEGGVGFLINGILFSGDTIFRESVGRCDLEGGNFETLQNSIRTKVFTLDDNVKIYAGHGEFSTVGHEKQNNNFM